VVFNSAVIASVFFNLSLVLLSLGSVEHRMRAMSNNSGHGTRAIPGGPNLGCGMQLHVHFLVVSFDLIAHLGFLYRINMCFHTR
jgi:hypothetical protein